jgi:hypothetical protein
VDSGSTESRAGAHRQFFGQAQKRLIAFAEHEFRLSKTDKKGVTRRAHLIQVAKTLKRKPAALIGPPFPERAAHLWTMYHELHSGRSYSSGGPNPLSWADIKAWDDLMEVGLKDWEVRAIKALDLLWLRVHGEDEDDG